MCEDNKFVEEYQCPNHECQTIFWLEVPEEGEEYVPVCPKCETPVMMEADVAYMEREKELIAKYALIFFNITLFQDTCPRCDDGKLVPKKNRDGDTFYGCTNYPDCKFTTNLSPRFIKEINMRKMNEIYKNNKLSDIMKSRYILEQVPF